VGEDLADDEVVEEHAQRRQVLLDGGDGERRRDLLDVGGEEERLELVKREPPDLAPGEEAAYGRTVGPAGVGVADLGGEELDEPPPCPLAGLLDDRGEVNLPSADDNPPARFAAGNRRRHHRPAGFLLNFSNT
jgi:hypothetical protein